MSKQKVFLLGSLGETGSSILEALIEDGSFDIICYIRAASARKPGARRLHEHGLKVVTGDLSTDSVERLASLLQGVDIVISSITAHDVALQVPLIDAAVQAGVKRFLPSNWGTPCPRGGIMDMRDRKEEVHDHIFQQRLGFTIIDVGNWYQVSFPRVPSGRFEYAAINPSNEVYAGGTTPNMLMHQRDVGRITVQIIKDDRTLNKRVYACSEVLSQNDIYAIIEEKTGEKLQLKPISAIDIYATIAAAREALHESPTDWTRQVKLAQALYLPSKYLRGDNTPENAEYLGYIDARILYPDFRWTSFANFVDELIKGEAKKPYSAIQIPE